MKNLNLNNVILVSPDSGASKKIYKLAEQIGYKGDIITCSKDRDKNGNLIYIDVPIENTELDKDIIIIDDICDGGATFNNISAALNDAGHKGKKYLIVTHGIFSKGFRELSMYFDGIYCTNSYRDLNSFRTPSIDDLSQDKMYKECTRKIKQLNVF